MKLNKKKITRLTDEQAKSVKGGLVNVAKTNGSTENNFTCCWCSNGDYTYFCATQMNC